MSYFGFLALSHVRKNGVVIATVAIRTTHWTQEQHGQNVLFRETSGMRAETIKTSTIRTLKFF
ncbi:MAG: hypothetical protein AUH36_02140 [Chloroflexi bacterium 13_1_40CM_55_7]|nr:MAG: hypothetical protein AUI17_08040 [Acidobacteriales bacterium 13_2_20CM_2_55_5]OLC22344.1 MAG: hypothetical protein AUH36_02140 [Chloroflexi bacterium 13_1_40CM_55_7]